MITRMTSLAVLLGSLAGSSAIQAQQSGIVRTVVVGSTVRGSRIVPATYVTPAFGAPIIVSTPGGAAVVTRGLYGAGAIATPVVVAAPYGTQVLSAPVVVNTVNGPQIVSTPTVVNTAFGPQVVSTPAIVGGAVGTQLLGAPVVVNNLYGAPATAASIALGEYYERPIMATPVSNMYYSSPVGYSYPSDY